MPVIPALSAAHHCDHKHLAVLEGQLPYHVYTWLTQADNSMRCTAQQNDQACQQFMNGYAKHCLSATSSKVRALFPLLNGGGFIRFLTNRRTLFSASIMSRRKPMLQALSMHDWQIGAAHLNRGWDTRLVHCSTDTGRL